MEAKNVIAFEFEKEGRTYRFELPGGAPLGEAYEAASSFLEKMVELINEHAKKSAPKEPEGEEKPEPPIEIEEPDTSKM